MPSDTTSIPFEDKTSIHGGQARPTASGIPQPQNGLRPLYLILAFILIGLLRSTELSIFYRNQPNIWPWWRITLNQLPLWFAMGAFSSLILHFSRRFPYENRGWWRTLCAHLAAMCGIALAVSLLDYLLQVPGQILLHSPAYAWTTAQQLSWRDVYTVGIKVPAIYIIIVLISWFWSYYQKVREKELQASELRAQLAQAQLQSLKMQMNPHFLFNTLNSISTLLRVDLDAAEHTLELLAVLLRRSLDATDVQEVSLREELAFIHDYLELEQIRFSNRLRLVWDIEPAAEDAWVPHLILQPLVENAIKHGFWPTAKPGLIRVSAQREGKELHLAVEDDGVGLHPLSTKGTVEGVGLSNSRARLRQLYGNASSLHLMANTPKGVRAVVVLPFHTSLFPKSAPVEAKG